MRFKLSHLILGLSVAGRSPISVLQQDVGRGQAALRTARTCGKTPTPAVQNGTVSTMVSDASSEDWATIGVKILSISLVPQGGGSPISVVHGAEPAASDQSRAVGSVERNTGQPERSRGNRTSANLTIGGNPLAMSCSPFPPIQKPASLERRALSFPRAKSIFKGRNGSAGNLTVPVNVSFVSPLVVTTGQSNALDLEFDLAVIWNSAFIVRASRRILS